MSLKRLATLAGLVVGAAALVLQFYLSIELRLGKGDSLLGALWFLFTFFTILTNLMLVLIYLSEVSAARWLGWWRSPLTRAMMVGIMAVVSAFYHVMLAGLWQPTGLQLFSDVVLHYVAPWFFILWWLVFQPHGQVRWHDIPAMTIFPLVYLVWAMFRGLIVGEYPYPILDANALGYGQVAINCLVMLGLFLAMFIVAAGLDKLMGRRAISPA
jgi:hypothetical protein